MARINRTARRSSSEDRSSASSSDNGSFSASRNDASRASGVDSASSNYRQRLSRQRYSSEQRTAASSRREHEQANVEQSYSDDSRARQAAARTATADYSANRYVGARNKSSRAKKVVIGVVIALAVVLVGVGIAAAVWYNDIVENISSDGDISNLAAPVADEPYYVLLIGCDSREGFDEEPSDGSEGERTDSIMVARIDEKSKAVSIISVPRDLRVNIEGHGYSKINAVVDNCVRNIAAVF